MRTITDARLPAMALIARKEILDHLLSLRFHACLVIMAGLLALSTLVMYSDFKLRSENYAVLHERARYRPGESGLMAVVPPRPLSILAKGLDEIMGRGYTITAYLGIEAHTRQKRADSLFALLPPPDLLYVVKIVLPLLALLLSYDAVTGERERGTLRLIFSASASRSQVALGKIAGGLLSLTLPFLFCLACAVAFLATRPIVAFEPADFLRLCLMTPTAILYLSFFYSLGVLVSSVARSSASSLTALLTFWAILVFVMPHAANLTAQAIAPLPSAETAESLRLQEFVKNRFLAIRSSGNDPEGSIGAFNANYDRVVEANRAKLDRLTHVTLLLGHLSPAATLSYVFTDLAGTGLSEHRRLGRALTEYKDAALPFLSSILDEDDGARQPPPELVLPKIPLRAVLGGGLIFDLLILSLYAAAMMVASVTVFSKSDPR